MNKTTTFVLLTVACAAATYTSVTHAQAPASIETVTYVQKGTPPSGPFAVVVEHDPKLATHTIYRPATLGPAKHSVMVWGEGACVKNGLTFPEYLSEIASHGFVVIADGPPVMPTANGPRAGAPAGAPRADGAPRGQAAAPGAPGA